MTTQSIKKEVKIKSWLVNKNNMVKKSFYMVACETEKAYQIDGFWISKSQTSDMREVEIVHSNVEVGCMKVYKNVL